MDGTKPFRPVQCRRK